MQTAEVCATVNKLNKSIFDLEIEVWPYASRLCYLPKLQRFAHVRLFKWQIKLVEISQYLIGLEGQGLGLKGRGLEVLALVSLGPWSWFWPYDIDQDYITHFFCPFDKPKTPAMVI